MSNERLEQAEKTVENYSLAVAGVGIVPVPILDAALTGVIEVKMIHQLAQLYEIEFSEQMVKSIIAALISSTVPWSFSSHLVKAIPGYGMAVGMVSRSLLGGASAYAMGKVFIQHFESGGTLLNFDPEEMREHYQKQLKEAPSVIEKGFTGVAP